MIMFKGLYSQKNYGSRDGAEQIITRHDGHHHPRSGRLDFHPHQRHRRLRGAARLHRHCPQRVATTIHHQERAR